MSETWRPVLGYGGLYEVSDLGRVRRAVGGRGATAGRVLRTKTPTRSCDYYRVQLCRFDIKAIHAVHVLVAEAFIGKRPRDKVVNHIDCDKLNNCPSNLEWVTRKQNARHALANGRVGGKAAAGSANGRAKLTEAQVAEIRRCKGRIGQRTLAAICGVSKSAIQFIHQGKHWNS